MKLQEHVRFEILFIIVSIKGRENGYQTETMRSFDNAHVISHSITVQLTSPWLQVTTVLCARNQLVKQ